MSETSIIVATATTDLSGDIISTPSELSTEVIVDTGDGLQRAVATKNIEGNVVSEASDIQSECVVETSDGELQRALKVYNMSDNGGGSSTSLLFLNMLTTGDMTSDSSFDVEWARELPDLSTQSYTASFTFEETEEDSGEWRLTCGVSKDGEYLGETNVYAQIVAYDGTSSSPIKLTTMTKDGENPYTYTFYAGDYECSFYVEIEDDVITFTGGNAYIGEDDYGSVDILWQIEP